MNNYIPDRAALMQEAFALISEMSDEQVAQAFLRSVPLLLTSVSKKVEEFTALL